MRLRDRTDDGAPPAETEVETEVSWEGAEALRGFLVPIGDLEPFPGNPRRGDVEVVRESLRRFGQVHAIVVAEDGRRIVAGHHVVQAATAEGWSHVAAIPNEFGDEEEARRYLLMDNRSHDRGYYDHEMLLDQLRSLESVEATGYSDAEVARLAMELDRLRDSATPPPEFPAIHPGQVHTEYSCPSCGYEWSGQPRPSE